ncbi:MAG: UTP--glucose-1-phosphate uridylyltransferase [Planctomycetes bacterium]|nr:UTP--glucose-1-phosphate uridylyltransferase [Planctomycetota bacterium]
MKITKAVITAAGKDQRTLPLQTIIDRDGRQKSALSIIVEEAESAGVEDIAVVVHPGDAEAYAAVAGAAASRLRFLVQDAPRGYGHALYRARDFANGEPFLHLVSDHLFVSREPKRCAAQLVAAAEVQSCAVSAVQATRESTLTLYGAIGGRPLPGSTNLHQIETVEEKPTPTLAEQKLVVPGLRAGHYLCFFGIHVLTPLVMEILERQVRAAGETGTVQLSPALAELASKERYLALAISGRRYNIGVRYGLFLAQLALILDGQDREEVLEQMVELLAARAAGR